MIDILACETYLSHGLRSKRVYSASGNSYTTRITHRNGKPFRPKK